MYECLTIKNKKQYTKCCFVNINRVNLKRETKNKFSSVQIVETADWFDKLFIQRIKIPIYSFKKKYFNAYKQSSWQHLNVFLSVIWIKYLIFKKILIDDQYSLFLFWFIV